MDAVRPTLIVVTGRPGSGKSTLVHPLARAVRCPVVSRDEIKEGLVNTFVDAADERALAQATYEVFFDTIRLLLDRKVTLVAEAAFQHPLWSPRLEEFRTFADVRIVVCVADASIVCARYVARNAADPVRGRFHNVGPPAETYEPPRLDVPTLAVDTTNGYRPRFEAIVEFASGKA